MKKRISFIFGGLMCISILAFGQLSSSKWQSKPIIIDGDASDWETMPRFFNSEASVQYEFRNNANNLYIILKSSNRATQMQMLQAGFQVRLKVKTQPPSRMDITFAEHKKGTFQAGLMRMNSNRNQLQEKDAPKSFSMPRDTAILDGFQYTKGMITENGNDSTGICFAKSRNNREQTVYEIQIPLREIYGKDYNLSDIGRIPLQLQVNINAISESTLRTMRNHMGGRGMGRMNGGDMEMGSRNLEGGMSGGGEDMGERPDTQNWNAGSDFSTSRKSFGIEFRLATDK